MSHVLRFSKFQDSDSSVILGDDSVVQATGIGTIIIEMHLPDGTLKCTLTGVFYVVFVYCTWPHLTLNQNTPVVYETILSLSQPQPQVVWFVTAVGWLSKDEDNPEGQKGW